EKAYLMIQIAPEDRDALRFFWFDENGEPASYRMKVVPFGTSASPFLLYAVIKHHFERFRNEFGDVISQIEDKFYVDDLLRALPTTDATQVQHFRARVVELFQLANMNIRKWRTNVLELDEQWAPEASDQVTVLGHFWNVKSDQISLAVDVDRLCRLYKLTKSNLSSFLSRAEEHASELQSRFDLVC